MEYITKGDTIIFAPSYNEQLDLQLLTNYQRIIFSNYKLEDNLFDAYKNNKLKKLKYIESKFDRPIVTLPPLIIHLTFGQAFNQLIDTIPSSITHLIFDRKSKFNQPLNNLPIFIKCILLPDKYNLQISNIPPKLKVIKYDDN